jgi:hypothetical protein
MIMTHPVDIKIATLDLEAIAAEKGTRNFIIEVADKYCVFWDCHCVHRSATQEFAEKTMSRLVESNERYPLGFNRE